MSDFPQRRHSVLDAAPLGVISTIGSMSAAGQISRATLGNTGAGVWPSNNLGIYMPMLIPETVTIYQMSFEVGTQSGNYDVGIYDESGARLVSLGSTAVPVAGIGVANIADTTLTPGLYYWAMVCSTTVASFRRGPPAVNMLRVAGLQQQAIGSSTLPNPATFAAMASAYYPVLNAHLSSVTV
jgi:hypothetical protein